MADAIIHSPMTGRIIEVLVEVGDAVGSGDMVAVVESMKMENEIISDYDGTVSAVHRERRTSRCRRVTRWLRLGLVDRGVAQP